MRDKVTLTRAFYDVAGALGNNLSAISVTVTVSGHQVLPGVDRASRFRSLSSVLLRAQTSARISGRRRSVGQRGLFEGT